MLGVRLIRGDVGVGSFVVAHERYCPEAPSTCLRPLASTMPAAMPSVVLLAISKRSVGHSCPARLLVEPTEIDAAVASSALANVEQPTGQDRQSQGRVTVNIQCLSRVDPPRK